MIKTFLKAWRELKRAPPGERFQREYRQLQQSERGFAVKMAFIGLGVVFIAAGIVMLFIPGPGLLMMFAGAVLVARQSLFAARVLDWTELRLRWLLLRARGRSPSSSL